MEYLNRHNQSFPELNLNRLLNGDTGSENSNLMLDNLNLSNSQSNVYITQD